MTTWRLSALTNILIIASPVILLGNRFNSLKKALPWALLLSTILNAYWFVWFALEHALAALRAGYYLWWASFPLLAIGWLLRQRSGRTERPSRDLSESVCRSA